MEVRTEDSSREDGESISDVADRVAWQWPHILPFVGPGRKHLEPAEPVVEEGEGSEVRVGTEGNFDLLLLGVGIGILGRVLDAPGL